MGTQPHTDVATGIGPGDRVAVYRLPDKQMATGSTLGGPTVCATIKATGAIEKVFSVELGQTLFGPLVLRHYDERAGMHLAPRRTGTFVIHPEHQQHVFALESGIEVREDIFVLNGTSGRGREVPPPAVYYTVELENAGDDDACLSTYAFADLRGDTAHDVVTDYDERAGALLAWNKSQPDVVRVIGCSTKPDDFETTLDSGMAVSGDFPGALSRQTIAAGDPVGVLRVSNRLAPGDRVALTFLLTFATAGRRSAIRRYQACPGAREALGQTRAYYHDVLSRTVVMTPNLEVNRGVLWAKANMLRVLAKAPTGWCFTNDPGRSNNSVGRDTAWFAFGADYLVPEFARESLHTYVKLQEPSGKIVEYYDIRTGKTEDYGLNINDNTPLLILAIWHHYSATGDLDFVKESYGAVAKAARYIVSQENEQGLVWCGATGTSDWGIVGWRNVIPNYRLAGATTEVNAECYAALATASSMARILGRHDDSEEFAKAAGDLKAAINTHLANPKNGLYYLNIDVDGNPRSDVTSDLVFPVMFGVADDESSARIIARLSGDDFWTEGGIRTTPRDALNYTPDGGWGLLGGVWVGVSFWYARAAARYTPEFMDHALSTSFHNYSRDPRRSNTVPGQFSEWLDGETLVNQGMMLSPWFPPRYVWAAVEGAAGFSPVGDDLTCHPNLAPNWKWLGVRNLPYRGRSLTWFAVRMPDLHLFTNFHVQDSTTSTVYEEDVSDALHTTGESTCSVGLRHHQDLLLFLGNTQERSVTTAVRLACPLAGAYRARVYNSLMGRWDEREQLVTPERLRSGVTVHIERQGFCVLELHQET